jgi:CRISPR-associated protein Csx17
MNKIHLAGCAPEPLDRYLKALGVFRLISEQADPEARASWSGTSFFLSSEFDLDGLKTWLIESYKPTPILSPWNGGSGFFKAGNTAGKTLKKLEGSDSERLSEYREMVEQCRAILKEHGIMEQPSGKEKHVLLRSLRSSLSDKYLDWLDIAFVITESEIKAAPIMGSGGNDGNLDFSNNFIQRLLEVIPESAGKPVSPHSAEWLNNALTGQPCGNLKKDVAIGQFNPGSVGGPNSTQDFEAKSIVNPWDYILMLEGTILFCGSTSRKLNVVAKGKSSFPFTVLPSATGKGALSEVERASARAEMWLPLWENPSLYKEIRLLFSEGRADLGKRTAKDGVEFARAIAELGVDRGIKYFTRYGFFKRSGKNHLAIPIDTVKVTHQPMVDLIRQIDPWLLRLKGKLKDAPASYTSALQRIDRAIYAFCVNGGASRMAEILSALGNMEKLLALNSQFVEKKMLSPAPFLSPAWLTACDDGSAEFRLAASLASILNTRSIGPLRENLEPVLVQGNYPKWSSSVKDVVSFPASLPRGLAAVLERRCLAASRDNLDRLPLYGKLTAQLADIQVFLEGGTDDRRIAELLWGAILIDWRGDIPALSGPSDVHTPISRPYALIKLLFLSVPYQRNISSEPVSILSTMELISLLKSGNVEKAFGVAARRLRNSGIVPIADSLNIVSQSLENRMAAAMLFPIKTADAQRLARLVIRQDEKAKK